LLVAEVRPNAGIGSAFTLTVEVLMGWKDETGAGIGSRGIPDYFLAAQKVGELSYSASRNKNAGPFVVRNSS
jgi:hypothetical protein